jgi:hypothetical protein
MKSLILIQIINLNKWKDVEQLVGDFLNNSYKSNSILPYEYENIQFFISISYSMNRLNKRSQNWIM